MSRFLRTAGLVVFAALALTWPAQAADVLWDDGAAPDHSLANPLNWTGDLYPAAADYGYIQAGYSAILDSEAAAFARLYVGDDNAAGTIGDGALNVTTGGSLALTSHLIISDSAAPVLGAVNVSNGSLSAADIQVGSAIASRGVMTHTGGAVTATGSVRVAYRASSYGDLRMSDGTLDAVGLYAGGNAGATAIVEQSGGVMTIGSGGVRIGMNADTAGLFNQTGGSLSINYVFFAGGNYSGVPEFGNWGQAEIAGTVATLATAGTNNFVGIGRADGGKSMGYLNLKTGGTLTTGHVRTGATVEAGGEGVFTFRGGTLKPNANTSDPADAATHFMRMPAAVGGVFIGVEGGAIDTDGFDVVISDPLQPLSGRGVSGFTFSGGSNYFGRPVVKITQPDLDMDGQRGRGATAVATVSGGAVTAITVTNPGTGYDPDDPITVTLKGGVADFYNEASVSAVSTTLNAADGGFVKKGLGMLTLAGANTYTGLTSVEGGTLRVTGSLAGNVTVADDGAWSGNLAAGAPANVAGNLDMSAGGDMLWKLAALADNVTGTAGVDFDQSVVGGSLSLGATSALTLDFASLAEADRPDAATPNAFWTTDHTWTILDAASVTGNFTSWINATFANGSFSTTLDAPGGNVLLNYVYGPVAQIPGDTNNDQMVDAADAQKLAENWGAQMAGGNSVGDFNNDGWVNAADASILAANWGNHTGESSGAVPEPSTLAIFLALLIGLSAMRRAKRPK